MKAIVVDKNSADGLDYSIQKKIFEENGIEFVLEDCQTEDEIIQKCKDADENRSHLRVESRPS